MGDSRSAYWSYTANRTPEQVKVIAAHNTLLGYSNQVCDIPKAPSSTRAITKPMPSSSYVLPLWRTSDREANRKKRVALYKAYAAEGKVKASVRKSLRWVKNKYYEIVHGY